jgi:hypothetical protein
MQILKRGFLLRTEQKKILQLLRLLLYTAANILLSRFCNEVKVQWISVKRGSHLFGANPEEQKQIENVIRVCFVCLGHHAT